MSNNISKIKLPGSDTIYELKDNNAAPLAAPQFTTKTESSVVLYPQAVTIGGSSNPTLSDSSENIATTKWVQSLLNKVVGYEVDPVSNTLTVSPLDEIANNQLKLVSSGADIELITGDEYKFVIIV